MTEAQLIVIGTTLWSRPPDAIISAAKFREAFEHYEAEKTLLDEFKRNASQASQHQAADRGPEWQKAKKYEDRCRAIFEDADEALKAEIRAVAGGYLIGSWWRA